MSTFNRNEEVQIYHNAINLYGEAIQTIVAIEECNELILALTNLRCGKPNNVEEETADVEIMLEQIKYLMHISDECIQDIKKRKIERQLERIEQEEKIWK